MKSLSREAVAATFLAGGVVASVLVAFAPEPLWLLPAAWTVALRYVFSME